MLRILVAAVATVVVALSACAPETVAPGPGADQPGLPPGGPSAAVNAADTAAVHATIRTLMGELLPNDQSVSSKFTYLVQVLDDPASAGLVAGALESVIDKILLEYNKYISHPKNGDPDLCLVQGPSGCQYTVTTLKDKLIADIYAYAGLSGNICKVSPTDPNATLCEAPARNAFVYFPPGIASQLTFVSIQNVTTPLNSGFDEYPVNVRVRTAPISSFPNPANRPIVVTCFAPGISPAAAERALLGHRHENADGSPGYFKFLPPAQLPASVLAQAESFCGTSPAPAGSILGLSTERGVGMLLARAVNAILPERLQAAATFRRAFAGASGSPEEFSTFGAVDPGLFRGGASGSPEEFAPPSAIGGPLAATYTPTTSTTSGTAGEMAIAGLPYVEVKTESGVPMPGVTVTFTLQPTTQPQYAPASSPAFCGATPPASVVVTTNASGRATLTCLQFGTVAGFADLKATLDPSTVQPLACMVTATGACASTDVAHFLVQTNAGPAAAIQKVAGDNQTAPAYSMVPVAPQVRVLDQYGNGVPGATITWSANLGSIDPNLGTGSPADGQTTTGGSGNSALTSWTLGVGGNTLLAETMIGAGVSSVTFSATGTFTLGLANACVTGGAKDDIAAYGFNFPNERNKVIQAVGVNLSSNGAPGSSENYEVTLRAERNPGEVRTAKARLQSSSNSSKGIESLVIFDFGSSPFPAVGGNQPDITVTLTAMQIINGQAQPLPSNRKINMNVGECPAGAKNCKPVAVSGAGRCSINESQLAPYSATYRRGFAGRVYVIE